MKTLRITSLSNSLHQYTLLLIMLIISFFFWPLALILIVMIYKFRKVVNLYILLLILSLFIISYYCYFYLPNNSNYYLVEKEKEGKYLLINGRKRYILNSNYNLTSGEIIIINETYQKYRKQTVPYGFNAFNYYVGQNINGYFNNPLIESTGNINQVVNLRAKLINNTNHLAWFFNRDYTNHNDFNYLFLLVVSTFSLDIIYQVIKKGFFYLNLSNHIQDFIILCIHLILVFTFTHIILTFYLFKLIINLCNKLFNWQLTKLDITSLQMIVSVILIPNIIFNQSFIIYFILVYSNSIIANNKFLSSVLMIPFQLMWFQTINIVNIISFRFMKAFRYFGLFLLLLSLFTSNQEIDNLLFSINNVLNKLPRELYNINMKNISFMTTIIYYALIIGYYYYPKIKTLLLATPSILIIILLPNYDNNTLYFLDVGQGNSAIYIYNNVVIGIDCYNGVDQFLSNHNLKLDYLIITHNDFDHMQESKLLIKKYNPVVIINSNSNILQNSYEMLNNKTILIDESNLEVLSKYNISFLFTKKYDNENDNSLVFHLKINKYKILFTGDISSSVEDDLIKKYGTYIEAHILVIPHHGSKTSTGQHFVKLVNPKYALISVGYQNRYQFPNEKVLDILINNKVKIYRTDLDGTIVVGKNKYELIIKTPYKPY